MISHSIGILSHCGIAALTGGSLRVNPVVHSLHEICYLIKVMKCLFIKSDMCGNICIEVLTIRNRWKPVEANAQSRNFDDFDDHDSPVSSDVMWNSIPPSIILIEQSYSTESKSFDTVL